jgi:hypothetical protein
LGTLSLLWGRVLPQTRKPYSKCRVTRLGSRFRSRLLIHCLMYRENDCLLCYYGSLWETNADVENEMMRNAELVYTTWLKLTSTSCAQSRLFHTMHASHSPPTMRTCSAKDRDTGPPCELLFQMQSHDWQTTFFSEPFLLDSLQSCGFEVFERWRLWRRSFTPCQLLL